MRPSPRFLFPGALLDLPSGLWVVDAEQPVAAVLDPADGSLRHLLDWRGLLPGGPAAGTSPVVTAWADQVWVQPDPGGPIGLVGRDGLVRACWSRSAVLEAAGPDQAWATRRDPAGPAVVPAGRPLPDGPAPDWVVRVGSDGRSRDVEVPGRARWLVSEPRGVAALVDAAPAVTTSEPTGTSLAWSTRWLRLPWDDPVPAGPGGWPERDRSPAPPVRRAGCRQPSPWWHRVWRRAAGREWHAGWSREQAGSVRLRRSLATARDGSGRTDRWDLGVGRVTLALAVADGMVLAVAREEPTLHGRAPVGELLLLRPGRAEPVVLMGPGTVETTDRGWPLVPRPAEEASYLAAVRHTSSDLEHWWHGPGGDSPLSRGLADCRTELVGSWPGTLLRWTFSHPARPGVRLRRHVALFDALGRPTGTGPAEVLLMEDLDCRLLPPVADAVDGILDI